jgi:recombination protein RecT
MAQELIATVKKAMTTMAPDFRAMLPDHIAVDNFTRVAQTAIQLNPDLQKCAPRSLLAACTKAAEAGLVPDGEQGAIVAYNVKVSKRGEPDRWEKQAKFLPMYQGLRDLVARSGEVKQWKARLVYEGDYFDYVDGDEEHLIHKPAFEEDAPITHVYSIAYLANGEISRCVMRISDVEKIRRRSKGADSGPWSTDYGQMAIKTCFRRHYKMLPRAKDDMARQRMATAVAAYDDAEGAIDITPPTPATAPTLSLADRSAAALEKATELTAFQDDDEQPKQPEPPQAPKTTRKRKTPSERLAEAEGRAPAGNGQSAPAAVPQEPSRSSPPASEAKPSQSAPSATAAPASSDPLPHEYDDGPQWEPDNGQDERQPGEDEIDPEELEGEDPAEQAYRDGWYGRLAMKVRTAPSAIRGDDELVKCWQAGWDAANKTIDAGNPPKTPDQSEQMLDAMVSKVFI